MKYTEKNSNGNAGEFYFAYWVSRIFGWPCRLLDIDVGIDAQVEVCENSGHVSGEFIGVQVKAQKGSKQNRQLCLNNLLYWKNIKEPIVVVSVCLDKNEPKMYWKLINNQEIDGLIHKARNNKSKKTLLKFAETDILQPKNKKDFKILPYIKASEAIDAKASELLQKVRQYLDCFFDEALQAYDVGQAAQTSMSEIIEMMSDFYEDLDEFCRMKYYDEVITHVIDNLLYVNEYIDSIEKMEGLTCEYIRYQRGDNTDLIESWRKHQYHPSISELIEDQRSR